MSVQYSFIIPVYRENQQINPLLDHLQRLPDSTNAEIIVVDGDPSESTLTEISKPGIRKITSRNGRGNQLNAGAYRASGDALIFLHADTRLPQNALAKIAEILKDEKIIGGAFDLGIDSSRFAFRVIEKIASLRSRLTRIPYGDQAIFIRRNYFQALGGFKDIPIMEDVELMRRIKWRRGKIMILKDKVKTSPRRWEAEGVVFCTLRNWFLITLYLLGFRPETLARFYR